MLLNFNPFVGVAVSALLPLLGHAANASVSAWYEAEIAFLADLKSRVTGTPSHNKLIDHIEAELGLLGLKVYTDTLNFTYIDQPLTPPSLSVGGQDVEISSYAPYSGETNDTGVTGTLIDLIGPTIEPNWTKAAGNIAVLNITNTPANFSTMLTVWPGQPQWPIGTGVASLSADASVANLTEAANAGVKGVIYVWEEMSAGNAQGQYVPFKRLYQGCPTVFVAADAAKTVLDATKAKKQAHLTLSGELIPKHPTRTIWTVVEGTKYPNESVIINTHTDGVNAVEENGHIALLTKAKDLVANPPERTTVLVFITGHMHQPAFSTKGRATTRWMDDNPKYWKGGEGQMKAIASTCVEHLGAIDWVEDLATGKYYTTGNQTAELLYANTPEVLNITKQNWHGAYPNFLRVNDPIPKGVQTGEGEPLTDERIPNMSIITTPLYLLAEWPEDFDERQLVDIAAMSRQIDSFMRIWKVMDTMPADSFGVVPKMGTPLSE
ncbi:uncharacterized protein PV06_02337 [Exophiala oligosperma]|uniref:Peptide hydrolase n=1 Tax=Exophiala oligosperma TaxID=215243 RepID=A0A0D2EFH6_9EURO|nr:uncharacterized protein PV06_02337 [Exophiala oligosperma]KIW46689.1 hypothetical protein PV06_02337 [Exophiala oligosperma]